MRTYTHIIVHTHNIYTHNMHTYLLGNLAQKAETVAHVKNYYAVGLQVGGRREEVDGEEGWSEEGWGGGIEGWGGGKGRRDGVYEGG